MNADALLTAPAFFADPYPAYRVLRADAPVHWSDAWDGWVLTRYRDILPTLNAPRLYSSAGRVSYLLKHLPEDVRAGMEVIEQHYAIGLAHSDPPAHTRLRGIVSRAFTPRMLEQLRPKIAALVDQLVEAALPLGRMDVIAGLAYPLPAIVIAELLGAPREDCDRLRAWALDINTLFSQGGRTTAAHALRAQHSLVEMRAYVNALADERRAHPREDLISVLARAADGDGMSGPELASTCVTLFLAGHETTTNMLGNAVHALLRRPAKLEELRRGLRAETPQAATTYLTTAVEELLRFDTPVQRGWRIATEDLTIDGHLIRKGQMVLQMLGSANHDPDVFEQPEDLIFERAPNRHLTFGHGIHFCLGGPLARIEIAAALSSLLTRCRDLRLDPAQPLNWRHDVALRGVESLPVRFDAVG